MVVCSSHPRYLFNRRPAYDCSCLCSSQQGSKSIKKKIQTQSYRCCWLSAEIKDMKRHFSSPIENMIPPKNSFLPIAIHFFLRRRGSRIEESNDVWMLLLMIIEEINRQTTTIIEDIDRARDRPRLIEFYPLTYGFLWRLRRIGTKKGFPLSVSNGCSFPSPRSPVPWLFDCGFVGEPLSVGWLNCRCESGFRFRVAASQPGLKLWVFSHIFGGI